jgi:putative transposase
MGCPQVFKAAEIAEMMGKSRRAIEIRAQKENWSFSLENGKGRGGKIRMYPLGSLPPDIQEAIYHNKEGAKMDLLPSLAPSVLAKVAEKFTPELPVPTISEAAGDTQSSWTPETAVNETDLQDPRIRRILAILREADEVPRDWTKGRRKWIEAVASRNDVSFQAIYRWQSRYEKRGIAGIRHEKSTKDKPKVWTPEAVDFWVSLCGKREHRHMQRKTLYDILTIEAERRNWKIGDLGSAMWWFKKRWTPLMEAMQRGGLRALDNALTPILRDYSDLEPFECLVGDQHRFDRWVVDEETGEVYRPEGYLWQDLRTRIIYGAAVDKKYDAWLIGQALRIGIRCFGAFKRIYTDNGKPELSRYLAGILASLRSLGMEWERTEDIPASLLDTNPEDIDPHYVDPGTHKKAIIKNAKAKMIEGTFRHLEGIMSSFLRLPGNTKRLSDDIHWQDIDHKEAQALAKQGKLLTDREFALALYMALDHYNRQKAHRGVLREWLWKPKPVSVTPYDCLRACYEAGWRPRMISAEAADLIFLAREDRVVDRGMINFNSDIYVHDALIGLKKGTRVHIRYNPMTKDELHVFLGGKYLCTALPVERSSMLDMDLAERKIREKRERRKRFAREFKAITSLAPDFREYSKVPETERVAALIGDERRKRAIENKAMYRKLTQAELDAEVAKLEEGLPLPKAEKPLPERPQYFLDELTRFEWITEYLRAGGTLSAEDESFKAKYLAGQTESQRAYYEFIMEEFR